MLCKTRGTETAFTVARTFWQSKIFKFQRTKFRDVVHGMGYDTLTISCITWPHAMMQDACKRGKWNETLSFPSARTATSIKPLHLPSPLPPSIFTPRERKRERGKERRKSPNLPNLAGISALLLSSSISLCFAFAGSRRSLSKKSDSAEIWVINLGLHFWVIVTFWAA